MNSQKFGIHFGEGMDGMSDWMNNEVNQFRNHQSKEKMAAGATNLREFMAWIEWNEWSE